MEIRLKTQFAFLVVSFLDERGYPCLSLDLIPQSCGHGMESVVPPNNEVTLKSMTGRGRGRGRC